MTNDEIIEKLRELLKDNKEPSKDQESEIYMQLAKYMERKFLNNWSSKQKVKKYLEMLNSEEKGVLANEIINQIEILLNREKYESNAKEKLNDLIDILVQLNPQQELIIRYYSNLIIELIRQSNQLDLLQMEIYSSLRDKKEPISRSGYTLREWNIKSAKIYHQEGIPAGLEDSVDEYYRQQQEREIINRRINNISKKIKKYRDKLVQVINNSLNPLDSFKLDQLLNRNNTDTDASLLPKDVSAINYSRLKTLLENSHDEEIEKLWESLSPSLRQGKAK